MALNISFGVSTWLWTSPFSTSSIWELFPKIAAMGFDVVEIALADLRTRGGLPGHRERVEAVLQAAHHLPGAVFPTAHRDDAIVAAAPALPCGKL